MKTNTISILDFPPILKPEHLDEMLNRIQTLHPQISLEGAKTYLCDLFDIKSLDLIEGDFLSNYEIEPALSRDELKAFAQRILSYNNGQIDDATYAARNILNSVPKSLDDLIDYTTSSRKSEFITNILELLPVAVDETRSSLTTLDELIKITKPVPEIIVDMACNSEMDRFQSTSIADSDGLTDRQKMLFMAANYYLNHLIGFRCNSVWLAAFLSSQEFGCRAGWLHDNGDTCNDKHFGFKDDEAVTSLVKANMRYIDELFQHYEHADDAEAEGIRHTFDLYVKTCFFAVQNLIKSNADDIKSAVPEIVPILDLLLEYDDLFNNEQELLKETTISLLSNEASITSEQIQAISEIAYADYKVEPEKFMTEFFDMWNFMIIDAFHNNRDDAFCISKHFVRAQFFESDLLKTAALVKKHMNYKSQPEHAQELYEGFLTNYLWSLVNRHSDTQYLYDAILKIVLDTKDLVDNEYIVRGMAELGYAPSMRVLMKSSDGIEKAYWERRISVLDLKHNIH